MAGGATLDQLLLDPFIQDALAQAPGAGAPTTLGSLAAAAAAAGGGSPGGLPSMAEEGPQVGWRGACCSGSGGGVLWPGATMATLTAAARR